jgi:hypothetical protein
MKRLIHLAILSLLLFSCKKEDDTLTKLIPTFSIPSGIYERDTVVEIKTSDTNAKIYYTTDGTNPDTTSTIYKNPIKIIGDNNQVTIKAIAILNDVYKSEIVAADFKIRYPNISPAYFNMVSGVYVNDINVVIKTETHNATIYYTIDGTEPTITSDIYKDTIKITGDGTYKCIKAIVKTDQNKFSKITKSVYKINYSYNPNTFNHNLSYENYTKNIVGKWIGYRECQWTPIIGVEIVFNNDGTYTATSLSSNSNDVAFYYGSDTDSNTYFIYNIYGDGSAYGEIGLFNDTAFGNLKFIRFSEDCNVLSLEFWNDNHGPFKYKLIKIIE